MIDHVRAPAQLLRRLKQIGVADEDKGQQLAVGQRLVTRDGILRRWDGFVSTGSGAAAAERLIRANRLGGPQQAIAASSRKPSKALRRRATRLRAMSSVGAAEGDEQRKAASAAEREGREAERAADAAAAAIDRLNAQREAVSQRVDDLAPVAEASAEALQAAEAVIAGLPIRRCSKPTSALRGRVHRMPAPRSRTSAPRPRRGRAKPLPRASVTVRPDASRKNGASGMRTRTGGSLRRSSARASRRPSASRSAAEPERLDAAIVELERKAGDFEPRNVGRSGGRAGRGSARSPRPHRHSPQPNESLSAARERRAAASARAEGQEARRAEYARVCLERFECLPQRLPEKLGFDESERVDAEAQSALLERLTAERERIGPVNLVAEQELAELDDARVKGAEEAEELTQAIHRLRGSIGNLNREGRVRLLDAYRQVDAHFRSLFTSLFDGGQAHLELVESDDPLEAGLEIMAQPPGKRLSTLTLLSGGEQALTAVALIFALFLTNPAPICVLDEVDAPLDDANVERFCDLLDRMTRETDTRYLIVTHNAVTMSRMHRLYGVTMIEKGISRLVSVDLGGAETLLAAE